VVNRILHAVHGTGAQEQLEMFYNCPSSGNAPGRRNLDENLPQPKSGTPGWGSLTLISLGDAGVTGAEESIVMDLRLKPQEILNPYRATCCVLAGGRGQAATEYRHLPSD
jgi:hypothetical protein